MLGDIVPNNAGVSNGGAADTPPTVSGGYGAAGFGNAGPAQPARPVQAVRIPDETALPAEDVTAELTQMDPLAKRSGSKVPLVLTLVGVAVFVSGVSGLFMYALSGS